MSWAVGHLVELAEPEEYDESLKRWSIKTLPVLPDQFKLRPDARNKKQLDVLKRHDQARRRRRDRERLRRRTRGRADLRSTSSTWRRPKKPVQRLWVSSMTKDAIREGFEHLRPGEEMEPLAAAARSRSEADWLVGMNATRAATVKGRSLGGVVSLGRVQTPTLALIVKPRPRDRRLRARDLLPGRRPVRARRAAVVSSAAGSRARTTAPPSASVADAVAAAAGGADALVATVKRTERKTRSPLLYDLTSLQRDANSRYGHLRAAHARSRPAPLRGIERPAPSSPTRERARSSSRPTRSADAQGDRPQPDSDPGASGQQRSTWPGLDVLPLARVVNDAKVDDHHAIVPTGELPTKELTGDDARVFDLVVRRFLAVFHPEAKFEDTEIVTEAGGRPLPHPRPAPGRGRVARRRHSARRPPPRSRLRATTTSRARPCRRSTRARRARAQSPRCSRSRPSRRRATPRRRFCATWRPPGSRSRTKRCARR